MKQTITEDEYEHLSDDQQSNYCWCSVCRVFYYSVKKRKHYHV